MKTKGQMFGYAKSGLARVLAVVSQFVLIALIGNVLGVNNTGIYASCFSFASILAIIFSLGQVASAVKDIPTLLEQRRPQEAADVASRAFLVTLLGSVAFSVPSVLVGFYVSGSVVGGFVAFGMATGLAFLATFGAITRSFGSVFLSEIIKTVVWRVVAILIISLAYVSSFELGIYLLITMLIAGIFLSLLVAVVLFVKEHNVSLQVVSARSLQYGWRVDMENWLLQSTQTVILNIDVVLVGTLLGFTDAGIYFLLTRMASLVSLPLTATNPVILPAIARIAKEGWTKSLALAIRRNTLVNIAASVAVCLVLALFHSEFYSLLGGAEFDKQNSIAFMFLVGSQLVNTVVGPTSFSSQLFNVRSKALFILLTCLTAMIPTLLLLTQNYGLAGAAFAVSMWRIFQNVATFELIRRCAGFNLLTARRR